MTARVGVVTFPGSLDDTQVRRAVGVGAVALWHASDSLAQVSAVILPGGLSSRRLLEKGAISRYAPILVEIVRHARRGLPVLGIGHGFHMLCETGLLPGGLTQADNGPFTCRDEVFRVASIDTVWTLDFWPNEQISLQIKPGEGRYTADAETLCVLEERNQIVLRYDRAASDGPDREVAGVTNAGGNVVGVIPHPEEAAGGYASDGGRVFTGVQRFLRALQPA
jgi:phosphoribosylformylglycinamidine synthase